MGAEGNIIIISFNIVKSNPLIFIVVNFVAQTGWVPFLLRAGRSSVGLLLTLVPQAFHLVHLEQIGHFLSSFKIPFSFFSTCLIHSQSNSILKSKRQNVTPPAWLELFSAGGVTAKHVCFMKFQAYPQHMGSKLWTIFEPWELWVDKMGLIYKKEKKKKKVQRTVRSQFSFLRNLFGELSVNESETHGFYFPCHM